MISLDAIEYGLLGDVRRRQEFLDVWHKKLAETLEDLHAAESKKDNEAILWNLCKLSLYMQDIVGAHTYIVAVLVQLHALDQERPYKHAIESARRSLQTANETYHFWLERNARLN